MIPINVTIGRIDLWESSGTYCGAKISLPAGRSDIQDAMDRARITDGQPYKIYERTDGNGDDMDYLPENLTIDLFQNPEIRLAMAQIRLNLSAKRFLRLR